MKKLTSILLVAIFSTLLFTGCEEEIDYLPIYRYKLGDLKLEILHPFNRYNDSAYSNYTVLLRDYADYGDGIVYMDSIPEIKTEETRNSLVYYYKVDYGFHETKHYVLTIYENSDTLYSEKFKVMFNQFNMKKINSSNQ